MLPEINMNTYKNCAGIYIFTNLINGKVYIGESTNIKNRMACYNSNIENRPIENAIRKYGLTSFKLEVEYFPNFTKNDLLDLEEFLIVKFNSLTPFGYNVCKRGTSQVGLKHSEKTLKKMSEAAMGRKHSEETRKKQSESAMGKKMNVLSVKKSAESKHKTVYKYSLDKNLICSYSSIKQAAFTHNCCASNITACCRNNKKTTAGFIWSYNKYLN